MLSFRQVFQHYLRNYWKIKSKFATSVFPKVSRQVSKKTKRVIFFNIICIFPDSRLAFDFYF